jgi:hypothetical protein
MTRSTYKRCQKKAFDSSNQRPQIQMIGEAIDLQSVEQEIHYFLQDTLHSSTVFCTPSDRRYQLGL